MEENDNIDLRKYISAAKRGWYWYAIAFVVFMALAFTYHKIHMDQFMVYSQVLIEDDEESGSGSAAKAMGGGMASIMRTFSIGGMGSASVDNELLIFQSHNILVRLVKELGINRTYIEKDGMKKFNLYNESPILVACPDTLLDTLSIGMKMKVHLYADGKADIVATKGMFNKELGKTTRAALPTQIKTPYGTFQVLKSGKYTPGEERDIIVTVCGNDLAVYGLSQLIDIDYSSKKSDGIALELKATNKQQGKDMLNSIMAIYNEIRLDRKNDRARQALDFYDKQIEELTASLALSEQKVQDFQTRNKIIDPQYEANYMYTADKESEKAVLELRNNIAAYNLILNTIDDPNRKYDLLPSPEGEASISAVSRYNDMILAKRNTERSANADNAYLKQLVSQIDAMRSLVRENVAMVKQNTEKTISSIQGANMKNISKLSKVPSYQREYIDLMRDKELKNDLYVFLLEKRYNNAMTLSSNFPRGFVVDPAYCDVKPLLKKSLIAFGGCLFMALLLPTILVCTLANRKRNDATPVEEEPEA